jgi:hypothetical protein
MYYFLFLLAQSIGKYLTKTDFDKNILENFILELLFIMFVDRYLYKTYILNIRVVNRFSLKTAKRACW